MNCQRALYINVGHTDIDLEQLVRWIGKCQLRAIYLIHDLIPLTHSEFCNPNAVIRHQGRVMNALTHGSGIITSSDASAQELKHFADTKGLHPPPIITAWLAGAQLDVPSAIPAETPPHFICVGTIEARKNHYLLLQIWRRMVERLGAAAPKLVIVGQKGAQASHVEAMLQRCATIQDHVITMPNCSDEDLSRWMGAARALLMPSFAEGFGLPLIEALQIGTPVIASDLPCFREIGEGIPTLLDPLDAISWERMIISFLEDGPERTRQLRRLREYRSPTWKGHFKRVEAWLAALPVHDTDHRRPVLPISGTPRRKEVAQRRTTAIDRVNL